MDLQELATTISSALATMTLDIDFKGDASWAPSRNPKSDFSRWGVWEAWLECKIEHINPCLVGPVPTGCWIMWNSETGQVIGFVDKSAMTAQWQAECACVSQNQGKPTRVVNPFGDAWESKIRLSDMERMLGPAIAEFEQARAEAAEGTEQCPV